MLKAHSDIGLDRECWGQCCSRLVCFIFSKYFSYWGKCTTPEQYFHQLYRRCEWTLKLNLHLRQCCWQFCSWAVHFSQHKFFLKNLKHFSLEQHCRQHCLSKPMSEWSLSVFKPVIFFSTLSHTSSIRWRGEKERERERENLCLCKPAVFFSTLSCSLVYTALSLSL